MFRSHVFTIIISEKEENQIWGSGGCESSEKLQKCYSTLRKYPVHVVLVTIVQLHNYVTYIIVHH